MNQRLPSMMEAKNQAKRLRRKLAEEGTQIGHAQSLELVAHQHGFRDWNTLFAAMANRPPETWVPGDRVSGRYLSRPFEATVITAAIDSPGWIALELELDEAVDVVTSDEFSNYRKRIRGIIGPKGYSQERTSDGKAHLQIDL